MNEQNKRAAVAVIGLLLIGWSMGVIDPNTIDVPVWWRLAATAAFLSLAAGYFAADSVYALLPEERGIFLVVFDNTEEGGGEIHELNKDQWDELTVYGSLHPWEQSSERVYECRDYDPDRCVAVGSWKESKPESALAAEATVEDALIAIDELRSVLEPDAAEARALKRSFRGIVRRLDKERAEAQDEAVDSHIAPNIGGSKTISEIVEESLPENLHPESMKLDEEKIARRNDSQPEQISFDLLEEGEALEPIEPEGRAD